MESLKITFKIASKEQFALAEINFVGAVNRPLIEAIVYLSNIRTLPLAPRSEGQVIDQRLKFLSFKSALLWVAYQQGGSINRRNFLDTFPFV